MYKNDKEMLFDYSTMNEIISEGAKAEKRKPLYKNLWYEQEVAIFFGTTNVGKSILAVQIAEEIARQGRKVIYFDYEMSMQQLSDRYCNDDYTKRYQFSENFLRPNLEYDLGRNFKERTTRLFSRMEEAVTLSGINIFIIDNITCLNPKLSNTEEAASFMIRFKDIAKKLKASVLLLGHSPKKSKGNSTITLDRLSGSKNISNFIDACFCMGKVEDGGGKVYIKQLKARSCAITLNENRVLVCSLTKRDDCFLQFKEEGFGVEKDLIKGSVDITPQKEEAYRLYLENKSYRKTARLIGVNDKTVKAWVNDYIVYNNLNIDNQVDNKVMAQDFKEK